MQCYNTSMPPGIWICILENVRMRYELVVRTSLVKCVAAATEDVAAGANTGDDMSKVGKHLQSFELFTKSGVVSALGETLNDDEFGCLWTSVTVGGETLDNVNCGQLIANKLQLAIARNEQVEMSFVRYNNGEKDFNSIAAIRTSMGVIEDVDFAVQQLTAAADKMRRYARIGIAISAFLIVTVFVAVIGVVLMVPSVILLRRSRRPRAFAEALTTAAKALR
jgi:hypothetical protein